MVGGATAPGAVRTTVGPADGAAGEDMMLDFPSGGASTLEARCGFAAATEVFTGGRGSLPLLA